MHLVLLYYKKYVRLSATEIGRNNLFVVATQFILHLAKHGSSIKMTQTTFFKDKRKTGKT